MATRTSSLPKTIERALQWRFVLLSLAVAVSFLALAPSLPRGIGAGWDKLNHMIAFAALAVAACNGLGGSAWKTTLALVGVLAFGASIELAQLFVAGRSGQRGDLLADALGTGAGAFASQVVWPAMVRMRQRWLTPFDSNAARR